MAWRDDAIAKLKGGVFDVLVVGGGIVGAGVARDAAMRGLKVALIDRHDFAEGTSSRSSRLLHGGLRYLAQGHLGLVREASTEKQVIGKIAPHLAQPLAFVFPTYKDNPSWTLWKLRIGVKVYDGLCGFHNFGKSQSLSVDETQSRVKGLKSESLTGAVRYFDGLTNDARLVLDTLRSAEKNGAVLVNRVKLSTSARDTEKWTNLAIDEMASIPLSIKSKWVVNCTGPWAPQLPNSGIPLRLTKGVHLVIDRAKLDVADAIVLTEGKRILFVIPWGPKIILGTTDTDYSGRIEDVVCTRSDAEYVLKIVNEHFPEAKLTLDDILSTWAGLRPLVADEKGHPSDVSRSHVIKSTAEKWLEIAGGKLTTYRRMAEQTIDRIAKEFEGLQKCATAEVPLVEASESNGLSAIVPPTPTKEAVMHYCKNEWAMTLEDVMVRRGGWHYSETNIDELARQVGAWMGEAMGWDSEKVQGEVEMYLHSTMPSWKQ